jgi:hypothetical protein
VAQREEEQSLQNAFTGFVEANINGVWYVRTSGGNVLPANNLSAGAFERGQAVSAFKTSAGFYFNGITPL